MKVQLQTSFTPNFGRRHNTTKPTGGSKTTTATSAMDRLIRTDKRAARLEGNARAVSRREEVNLAHNERRKFRRFVASLKLDTPILPRAKFTRGMLLSDICNASAGTACTFHLLNLPGYDQLTTHRVLQAIAKQLLDFEKSGLIRRSYDDSPWNVKISNDGKNVLKTFKRAARRAARTAKA